MTMPAEAHPDVSADPDLPTNLLYPSIRLLMHGEMSADKAHLPLQEHAYRIANQPNTFFYVLPHETQDVLVFVRNFGSQDVSLVQRFNSLQQTGVVCVCPANAQVCFDQPIPLSNCSGGVDILNSETGKVLMRLRFNGRPIPPDFVPYRREGAGWTSTHGYVLSLNTDMTELHDLLVRLTAAHPAVEPLGGPMWDYAFSPYRTSWYTLLAEKCRTILQRSKVNGKDDSPDLLSLAEQLEAGAKNSALRRRIENVPGIVERWTALEPRIVEWIKTLDAYTKLYGLKYTNTETPARQHYILDHCAKYLLQEMRRFVKYYREDTKTVAHV